MSPRLKRLARKRERDQKAGKKLRLVGYGRVSTEEQARDGASLEMQENKGRVYCDLVDARLVAWKEDRGLSGRTRKGRDALDRALDLVFSGEADGIIVYSLDRLTRSAYDFMALIKQLQEKGKVFISVRENLDTSSDFGKFTAGILALLAELESDRTSRRVTDVMNDLKSKRRVYAGIPYGFRERRGMLVEIPEEVDVVKRICLLRMYPVKKAAGMRGRPTQDGGMSYNAIADRLNADRVPAQKGGQWHAFAVQRVWENAFDLFPELMEEVRLTLDENKN